MQTSNFSNNGRHELNGIGISVNPPWYFKGPSYAPLVPPADLVTWFHDAPKTSGNWAKYQAVYGEQLAELDSKKVSDDLHEMADAIGASEPIILCWESAKARPILCHRRLVATWLESELEISVPEWSKDQGSSLDSATDFPILPDILPDCLFPI